MIISAANSRRFGITRLKLASTLVLSVLLAAPAFAQLRVDSSIHSIGIEYDTPNDANNNASATVRYRPAGQSQWVQALPLFRIEYQGDDMLAGSILYLEPGTSYEIELDIVDPDGPNAVETVFQTTKVPPVPPQGGRVLHVAPGSGPGTGTEADPIRGLETAWAQAQPGDTFLLHGGDYGFVRDNNGSSGTEQQPIVFKAHGNGDAIIRSLQLYNQSNIWFEGLVFDADPDPGTTGDEYENGLYSVVRTGYERFGTPHDVDNIVIIGNTFRGYFHSILAGRLTDNWYIADNTIVGNQQLGNGSIDSEGIELGEGNDHTVAHNSITLVADGVSFPGENCDIFGNDIFDVTDDGIELDEGGVNTRAWGNRIHNAGHNGISMAPMNGAPWYILRNQIINYQESAFKFRDPFNNGRFFAAHNTIVNSGWVTDHWTHRMLRGTMRNNLLISVSNTSIIKRCDAGPSSQTDWDYDGFDWGSSFTAFNCQGDHGNISSFSQMLESSGAVGTEANGIRVRWRNCFEDLDVPGPAPSTTIPPQHATLNASCNAVDAGQVLPNINDGFTGNAPDLGALEVGQPLPHYGPRAENVVVRRPMPPEDLEAN